MVDRFMQGRLSPTEKKKTVWMIMTMIAASSMCLGLDEKRKQSKMTLES